MPAASFYEAMDHRSAETRGGVGHGQHYVGSAGTTIGRRIRSVEPYIRCFDDEHTALHHAVARVQGEIQQHLLDPLRFRDDWCYVRLKLHHHFNLVPNQPAKRSIYARYRGVEI